MKRDRETVEGWVVDLICIRNFSLAETLASARVHTRACALMGHCIESGYGLVHESGQVTPLDPDATPMVVAALHASPRAKGTFLRAERERGKNGKMFTLRVREVPAAEGRRTLAARRRRAATSRS